jgi:uncharacterized protein YndB with AHSA1/START domain
MTPAEEEAIVIRRRIAATREEVFDAWTDAEGMRSWMCPGDIASSDIQLDLRVGGALRVVMHGPAGTSEHWGEFTVLDRPLTLAFTWHAVASEFLPTLVTIEFFESADGYCDLVLKHQKLQRPDVREQYRGGWGVIVARLETFLRERRQSV